jgi:hypothetical protein
LQAKVFTDALAEIEFRSKKQIIELEGISAEGEARETVPPHLVMERMNAIIEVLMTLVSKAKLPWAVSTVKGYFKQVRVAGHTYLTPPLQCWCTVRHRLVQSPL